MSTPVSSTLKYIALATLCIQNCALILSMRYSRSVLHDDYLDSTIVVVMELTKFCVAMALVLRDKPSFAHILSLIRSSLPISIPSLLFVIQNTCQLAAVKNLDASTFSVLSQAKVLTTAICSVIVLRVTLSPRKWRALGLLVLGCILVQYTPPASCGPDAPIVSKSETDAAAAKIAFGLLMTGIMVSLSGIAGVTIERILKNQGPGVVQMTIWERNVQLSFWGFLFALVSTIMRDNARVAERGFFGGWSSFAIIVVLCQSLGGLVTAVVVKYTNTIIKGFAVGLSVVFTSILSIPLFHSQLTLIFTLGASAVLLSVFNFNEEDTPLNTPSAEAKKFGSTPGTPMKETREIISAEERSNLLRNYSANNHTDTEDDLEMASTNSAQSTVRSPLK